MAFGPFQRTAPAHPWVGRLLVVTLLAAAFGGWWWMLQRTLDNEQNAVTSRLETELESRFDRGLDTVRDGLERDRSTATEALRTDPAGAPNLIENGIVSAILEPEPEFTFKEGLMPGQRALVAETRVLRIERGETGVRQLVDEVLASREQAFDDIVIEVPDTLTAFVDRDALGSIIGNLVENAWKYSPEAKWLAIRARQEDHGLVVDVEDRGIGLDTAQQRKVFRQFWRAETGLDRQVDGLGLGLTIVARLADAHGGRIELESTPGSAMVELQSGGTSEE